MDDLDHSGFAFDDSHMGFETIASLIVKGIARILPQEFRRKIDLLDEKQYTENVRCPHPDLLILRH